ncbi:hypothetical protein RND81_11G176600 [Saponaria officinalis]|uniref:Uncharacterized protein n=1 Tax=Saponaria officinalis TaxID=3572 RepID=A0AAW1HQ15_SAPOF
MEVTSSLISHHHLSLADSLQISSIIAPINTVASPPVKSRHITSRRPLLKRRRRTRRRSPPSSGDDIPFLGGADDGGIAGGGGIWNFGGGGNWSDGDWFSSNDNDNNNNNPDDPAFDFVFEVVCWIVFSNCVHFAFTKVFKLVSEERAKVTLRSVL